MRRKYISPALYIIGMLSVVAGAVLRLQGIKGADSILLAGLLMEVVATGFLVWVTRNQIKA